MMLGCVLAQTIWTTGKPEDEASAGANPRVERVDRERQEHHQRDVGTLHEAVVHHDHDRREHGRPHQATGRRLGLGAISRPGVQPQDPRHEGDDGRLQHDHAGGAADEIAQVEHDVEEPLRVVVGQVEAAERERLVGGEAALLHQVAAERQVGERVGIVDAASAPARTPRPPGSPARAMKARGAARGGVAHHGVVHTRVYVAGRRRSQGKRAVRRCTEASRDAWRSRWRRG